MELKSEDKAIGKENFYAAIGTKTDGPEVVGPDKKKRKMRSGRSILNERIAQGERLHAVPGYAYFGYESSVSSPVRVGVIGTGDEGSVLIGAINPDYIQVKSIADIRPYNRYRAFHGDCYSKTALKVRPGLMEKYGWKTEEKAKENVKVYKRYQDLIANAGTDDIEAVIIALPLHLHAPAAIAAMNAGLHVLTEKLMAHNVCQCKEMAIAARETDRHLATGHQRHYNILYDNAVALIKRGVLGDLHYIRAQWHRGNLPGTDSWQQPLPKNAKPSDPQHKALLTKLSDGRKALKEAEEVLKRKPDDRNRIKKVEARRRFVAQVKAQIEDQILCAAGTTGKPVVEEYGYKHREIKNGEGKVVYDRPAIEELIRWRLWDRTGGGLMAELGSHQLDAASIFIAAVHDGVKQQPLSVGAAANRPVFPADRDVDDHVFCVFEFPAHGHDPKDPNKALKRIGVQYASINGNGYGGYGETVFGTKGTLLLEREKEAMLWQTSHTDAKINVVKEKDKRTNITGPTLKIDPNGDPASVAYGMMATKDAGRGYQQELEHWAWCIRKNPENSDPEIHPKCDPKVALGDAVIALTTNMAARHGMRVEFKEAWFDPADPATPERDVLGEDVKPDIKKYT